MKQIPNLFTLLNLVFGCMAIVLILQTGQTIVVLDNGGATEVVLPEKMGQGALFIFAAAIVDFLDGFLARLLKANSSMGQQLDSLSDVVSFGVAPGAILYQLLRMAYAQQPGGLDVSLLALVPAFAFTAAVAWRLAKFNISSDQTASFRGVPSPAAGLLVASLPLIMMTEIQNDSRLLSPYLVNEWVLYGIILLLGFLMLCAIRFMAVKFTNFSFRDNKITYLLLLLSAVAIVTLQWLAVPVIFVLYLVLSQLAKKAPAAAPKRTTTDLVI